MKTEFTAMTKQLEEFTAGVLAWARQGPRQGEFGKASAYKARTAEILAAWESRRSRFASEQSEAMARSREEIAALAESYLATPTGPSLWSRFRKGLSGLAGRGSLPQTLAQVGELIGEKCAQARQADIDARDALVIARQLAGDEERNRLAFGLSQLIEQGAGPLMAAQSAIGRKPYAPLEDQTAQNLSRLAVDGTWRGEGSTELREAVRRTVEVN